MPCRRPEYNPQGDETKHTMDAPSAAIAKVVVVHVFQTRLEKCRYTYKTSLKADKEVGG